MAKEHGGTKGSEGGGLGGKSGSNIGGRRGTSSIGTQGNTHTSGKSTATSGPKSKKKKRSVMRESTWNNMSAGQRRNEFGTASYAKYKAGNTASSGGGSRSDR